MVDDDFTRLHILQELDTGCLFDSLWGLVRDWSQTPPHDVMEPPICNAKNRQDQTVGLVVTTPSKRQRNICPKIRTRHTEFSLSTKIESMCCDGRFLFRCSVPRVAFQSPKT